MPIEEPGVTSFAIEPLNGMFGMKSPGQIPPGGSPDMLNLYVRGNTLRKRPGFSQVGDAVSSTEKVMGLYSAWDDEDNVFLFAATQTGIKRYTPGTALWTAYTGPALTGGTERLFSWDVSQNSVVFSQGVDQVMRIPFTGTAYAILNANCPPARFLCRFADRLYLASTVEGGVRKPFRVRRAVNSDHTDWTGLGSGFNDLSEYPYHIKGMVKHGSLLMVTSEQSIWMASRTGISAAPARYDPVVPGVGVYCPHTLTTRVNEHLFVGRDSFYLFDGSRAVEIGPQVRDAVFFNLEASKVHLNFSVIRPESQEWIVFLCETGSTTPNIAWVWNWHYDIWYKWQMSGPVCGTIHRQDVSRIWDSLAGGWDSATWEWSASEGSVNFPLMITGHTNGKAYQWKEETPADDDTPISCRWTSKDFSASLLGGSVLQAPRSAFQEIMLKSLAIEYEAAGTDATLSFYLSNDVGVTWTGPYAITLSAAGGTAVLSEKISGVQVRWKFEHTSATEKFRISRFIPEFEILGMPLSPTS